MSDLLPDWRAKPAPALTHDQRMTLLGNKGALARWIEQHKAEGIAAPAVTAAFMAAIKVIERHLT